MKFLIVDDDARTRRLIREVLSKPGTHHEFCEASDGDEAATLYGEFMPDWVIMDIAMEPVDGIVATRLIHGQDPDARVVVLTHHDSRQIREAALEAGAYGYLVKDDLSDLEARLKDIAIRLPA